MRGGRGARGTVVNADPIPGDVEELLRAAQDDLLLKLSVDAHTTATSSSLDPDLSRRFDALRSNRPSVTPRREPPADGSSVNLPGEVRGRGEGDTAAGTSATGEGNGRGQSEGEEDEVSKILGNDLAARFAALKGLSSSFLPTGSVARQMERTPKEVDDDGEDDDSVVSEDYNDGVSRKEVEKLMQWAMDAARLDPDPSNSDDDDETGKREGSEQDEDYDDGEDDARAGAQGEEKKEKKKKKMKQTEKKVKAEGDKPLGRKWFLF